MPATDTFSDYSNGLSSPAVDAVAITPHDSTNLTQVTRAIWVGVSGNIAVVFKSGAVVVLKNVPAGVLPVRASRINATSTTATDLVALY